MFQNKKLHKSIVLCNLSGSENMHKEAKMCKNGGLRVIIHLQNEENAPFHNRQKQGSIIGQPPEMPINRVLSDFFTYKKRPTSQRSKVGV